MRKITALFTLFGAATLCLAAFAQTKPTPKPNTPKVTPTENAKVVPTSLKMAYALNAGDIFRYRVTGLFNGHFPPFAQPGSPPINLKIVVEYAGKVNKVDDKGAEVAFVVDKGDLYLLEKEPGEDGKTVPADETPFPIPLSTVQKSLNATAVVRPDGSVASINSGDAAPVQINLGIDLRKLFLLIMPVTFAEKPVKVNEEWAFKDGLLGQSEGKIAYTGKLEGIKAMGKGVTSNLAVSASSKIDEKKNKEGKLTDNAEEAVETSVGFASIKGIMTFAGTPKNDVYAGRLKQSKLTLIAKFDSIVANPIKPEEKLTTPIDVKARLTVQEIPTKPAAKTAQVTKENPSK